MNRNMVLAEWNRARGEIEIEKLARGFALGLLLLIRRR